ncbi:MAG: zinc ribbon domain-containing protein [Eubacteriales bacterium]|nr:zinc ribbon domain-containing protein [Eubacteriales bacterium]MDY3332328.1 zinc ribbon domain-containing protein [Gallibacter sp.]
MICNNCGKDNKEGYMFCVGCGAELSKVAVAQSSESNTAIESGESKATDTINATETAKDADTINETELTKDTDTTESIDQTNTPETNNTVAPTLAGGALGKNIFNIFFSAIKKPVTTAELMVDNANVLAAIIFIVLKSLLSATFVTINSTYSYNSLFYNRFYMGDEVTVFILTSVLTVLFDIIFVTMLFVIAKIFGSATMSFKKMLSGYSATLAWPTISALALMLISELQSVLLSLVVLFLAIFAFVIQLWATVMVYVKAADIKKDKLAISFAIGVIATLFIFVIVVALVFGELSVYNRYGF